MNQHYELQFGLAQDDRENLLTATAIFASELKAECEASILGAHTRGSTLALIIKSAEFDPEEAFSRFSALETVEEVAVEPAETSQEAMTLPASFNTPLPVTPRGRRKKAQREGWATVTDADGDEWRATFPDRGTVVFRGPGNATLTVLATPDGDEDWELLDTSPDTDTDRLGTADSFEEIINLAQCVIRGVARSCLDLLNCRVELPEAIAETDFLDSLPLHQ